jgi:hypothetical protein
MKGSSICSCKGDTRGRFFRPPKSFPATLLPAEIEMRQSPSSCSAPAEGKVRRYWARERSRFGFQTRRQLRVARLARSMRYLPVRDSSFILSPRFYVAAAISMSGPLTDRLSIDVDRFFINDDAICWDGMVHMSATGTELVAQGRTLPVGGRTDDEYVTRTRCAIFVSFKGKKLVGEDYYFDSDVEVFKIDN